MDADRHHEEPQKHSGEPTAKQTPEAPHQPRDAKTHHEAEMAARSVMHPESYDREWRYYHGAWGG